MPNIETTAKSRQAWTTPEAPPADAQRPAAVPPQPRRTAAERMQGLIRRFTGQRGATIAPAGLPRHLPGRAELSTQLEAGVSGLIDDAKKGKSSVAMMAAIDASARALSRWYSGTEQVYKQQMTRSLADMSTDDLMTLKRGIAALKSSGEPLHPRLQRMEKRCLLLLNPYRLMEENLAKTGASDKGYSVRYDTDKALTLPVSQSSYKDLCRSPYAVKVNGNTIKMFSKKERSPVTVNNAVTNMATLVAGGDVKKMASILDFAHQGLWAGVNLQQATPHSAVIFDGVPGSLICDPERELDYVLEPQSDGSTIITSTARFNGSLRFRPHDAEPTDSEKEIPLGKESHATWTMKIRVSADGTTAQYVEPVRYDMDLRPRSTGDWVEALVDAVAPDVSGGRKVPNKDMRDYLRGQAWEHLLHSATPDDLAKAFVEALPPKTSTRRLEVLQQTMNLLMSDRNPAPQPFVAKLREAMRDATTFHDALKALMPDLKKDNRSIQQTIGPETLEVHKPLWDDLDRIHFKLPQADDQLIEIWPRSCMDDGKLEIARTLSKALTNGRLDRLMQLGRFMHQEVWSPLEKIMDTSAPLFTIDGQPANLVVGYMEKTLTVKARDDGGWSLTCTAESKQPTFRIGDDVKTTTAESSASISFTIEVDRGMNATVPLAPVIEQNLVLSS